MNHKCACWQVQYPLNIKSKSRPFGPWIRNGSFLRKSDSQQIQRWRCTKCSRTCSLATGTECFGQKKRRLNLLVERSLCSGVTQRRTALILGINRKTVVRKFLFMARKRQKELNTRLKEKTKCSPYREIQFDEMETHEISKWKPLSIALAVSKEREILGFSVSKMPARGLEAAKARAKYGYRADDRRKGMLELLKSIKPMLHPEAQILSDQKTLYKPLVRALFPEAEHVTFKGRRGCVVGQGELKNTARDPLFSLNHSAAMLRANVNRLIRRTWSVTQKPERLLNHLYLYAHFHNLVLLNN